MNALRTSLPGGLGTRRQVLACSRGHVFAQGFTLVEMIMVMVITGILAGMVALFIRSPIQSYVDAVGRAELSDTADTALRRMARDLRLALPNSVRVSGDGKYLELLLTKTGGRYLSEDDEQGLGGILSFNSANAPPNPLQFSIVGTPPGGRQAIVAGDSIVVYNLGPGFDPADAYNCTGSLVSCNRAVVTAINGITVTLQTNPFQTQVPSMPSPTSRFQVVSTPVTYYCNGTSSGGLGQLTRYSGYAIQSGQPVAANAVPLSNAPVQARMADRVVNCNFSMTSLANVQRGLVSMLITLGSGNETLTLQQQVHVDNAP